MALQPTSPVTAEGSNSPLSPKEQAACKLYASLPLLAAGGPTPVELISGEHRGGGLLLGATTALAQNACAGDLHNAVTIGMKSEQKAAAPAGQKQDAAKPA